MSNLMLDLSKAATILGKGEIDLAKRKEEEQKLLQKHEEELRKAKFNLAASILKDPTKYSQKVQKWAKGLMGEFTGTPFEMAEPEKQEEPKPITAKEVFEKYKKDPTSLTKPEYDILQEYLSTLRAEKLLKEKPKTPKTPKEKKTPEEIYSETLLKRFSGVGKELYENEVGELLKYFPELEPQVRNAYPDYFKEQTPEHQPEYQPGLGLMHMLSGQNMNIQAPIKQLPLKEAKAWISERIKAGREAGYSREEIREIVNQQVMKKYGRSLDEIIYAK